MKVIVVIALIILTTSAAVRTQFITNSNNFINRRCENPNQRAGTCVAIHDCQVLLQSDKTFIEASRCGGGFGRIPYVCCSSDTGFTREPRYELEVQTTTEQPLSSQTESSWLTRILRGNFFTDIIKQEETKSVPRKKSLYLPEPPTCGGEFIDNRIYGGRDTELFEFPWMAFLEYTKSDPKKEAVCAGSLINSRYVLTAAHCVESSELKEKKGELIAVRLGIRDFTKASIFPEDNQRWRIMQKIVHENYKDQKTNLHDVALLRLESTVRYFKNIRPICLPSVLPDFNLKTGTKLTVAGWGRTQRAASSPIKQKVNVALVDQKFCKQQYAKLRVSIESTHICAGGTANQDSCRGDSGAPLMHYRNGVWVLEGVVSFGHSCGEKDFPGVYARVSSYTEWINKKLLSY